MRVHFIKMLKCSYMNPYAPLSFRWMSFTSAYMSAPLLLHSLCVHCKNIIRTYILMKATKKMHFNKMHWKSAFCQNARAFHQNVKLQLYENTYAPLIFRWISFTSAYMSAPLLLHLLCVHCKNIIRTYISMKATQKMHFDKTHLKVHFVKMHMHFIKMLKCGYSYPLVLLCTCLHLLFFYWNQDVFIPIISSEHAFQWKASNKMHFVKMH